MLLAVPALFAVPYGSVDPWWEGAACAAVFALGALWMVEGMLGGRWLVAEHKTLLPLVALVAFAVAQTIPLGDARTVGGVEVRATLSADPFETWRGALRLAALALFAALLLRYTSSARRLRAVLYVLLAVGLASALFGFARGALPKESLSAVSPRLAANVDGYAQFINRNHFALLAEISLGAAMGLLLAARRRRERLLVYTAALLAVWCALVLSNSRGGILGACAGLAIATLLYLARVRRAGRGGREEARARRGRRRALAAWAVRVALAACVVGAALTGVLWVGGERLAARLETVPAEVGAGPPRVRWGDRRPEIWDASWRLFEAHPLAGVGFGAYRAGVTCCHDASGEMSLEQAHNEYLELLASGGVIGAALAAWQIFLFARRSRETLRSHDRFRRAACTGALGGLAAVAVHSLFDFGLHVTANSFLFTALAATVVVGCGGDGSAEGQGESRAARAFTPGARGFEAKGGVRSKARYAAATVALAVFCWAAWHSARAGAARLLSESATRLAGTEYEGEASRLASAAARLSPSDPESYYALAVAFAQRGDMPRAVAELERATALRPGYYLNWVRLGRARERAGDVEGALAAYREAIKLAPLYAEPRWQSGNTLLRAGRPEEAFAELRLAAASRPALFPYTAELAWRASGGDAGAALRALSPQTAEAHAALARFFVKRGVPGAAIEQYRAARVAFGEGERRALVSEMFSAGMFREAHEVWADGGTRGERGAFYNGGFESSAGADEPGFDWRFARDVRAVEFALDAASAHGGSRSLSVEFKGEANPLVRLVTQTVLVEPGARYRLRFAARAESLTSGGMPVVAVMKAGGDEVLAQSEALPRDTGGWRVFELEFRAPGDAVTVVLRRAGCKDAVCPAFGRAWFDDFTLHQL